MLPPRFVRRLVLAPLVILIALTAVLLSPLLLLLAAVAVPSRDGRRRALRLVWFGVAWLVMECAALAACLGLWIASGFGGRLHTEASMDRHYGLVRWFLATLFRRALRVFRLRVEIEEPPATAEELAARLTRPVIVLSRHAGPGDSFLLVHHLLSLYRRKPRIVMKAALQFDPSLDVVINRLPHAFVRPNRSRQAIPPPRTSPEQSGQAVPPPAAVVPSAAVAPPTEVVPPEAAPPEAVPPTAVVPPEAAPLSAGSVTPVTAPADAAAAAAQVRAAERMDGAVVAEIRRLASSLGPTGALVIFPEGGNFTPNRWRHGISRLEASQRHEEARRARGMANLLPPRSGGAFAAIDSAPTADVIFVAHTGLDDLITVGDVWRALPMEQVIKARWWRVPAAEVPRDRDELVRWLYDWWERIDAWIADNRPVRSAGARS